MKYVFTFFATLIVVGVSAIPLNGDRTNLLNGNRSDIFINNLLGIFNGNNTEENPLDKDLIDFVRLIPHDKLKKIATKYLHDTQLIKQHEYVTSEEFHNLVYAVEALPEHQRYVLYIQESGYDKIRELKAIHSALGMKEYVPPKPSNEVFKKNDERNKGGLNGFIEEVVAILPVKEIKELHEKKLKESKAFAKFSSYILSEELQEIYKELRDKEQMKEMLGALKKIDIEFMAILDLQLRIVGFRPDNMYINTCFARITVYSSLSLCDINYCVPFRTIISTTMKYVFTFFATLIVVGVSAIPLNGDRTDLLNGNRSNIYNENSFNMFNGNYTPSLDKELSDFMIRIPLDKLGAILEKYKNDPQIINGYTYLYHKHFHGLVYAAEALPEYHRYVLYLQESGLDVIKRMRIFHLTYGMEDYVPPKPLYELFKREDNFEGGFKNLFKEIIAILPVEELKELHKRKLKESETFSKFVSYVSDKKFSDIRKDLGEKEPIQEIIKYMRLVGIDYLDYEDLLKHIFGFES
ncbi:uncharacterized protein LOC118444452 [Vespa mandarinia]|uniref:uncharacterized protein LOC118444452 n=1 Tax=Vespa mandarinia TaxID=7446 RepID=UPI00161652EA|nr:uncharacterized protein LOC118444452 [Vespa mandarinia]